MSPEPAPPPPARSRAPWWQRDRRWTNPAAAAVGFGLLGGIATAALSGLGGVLTAESGFGAAATAVVVTGLRLRQAWVGRADDDVDTYSPGVPTELISTGLVGDDVPLAHVNRDGAVVAVLHHTDRAGIDGASGHTVTARLPGPDGPRDLHLEQRAHDPAGDGPATDGPGPVDAGTVDAGTVEPGAEMAVRWVGAAGAAGAVAYRHAGEHHDHWLVVADGRSLALRVPHGRRPNRRTLIDTTTGRAYLLTHDQRERRPYVRLQCPPDLGAVAVTLCLWLVHVIDAHARAREPWEVPRRPGWTVVADDFPAFIGPGGFGDTRDRPGGGSGGGGAGGT